MLDPDDVIHKNAYGSIKSARWPDAKIPYLISPSFIKCSKFLEHNKHSPVQSQQ